MSHIPTTSQWILITGVSNITGYQYFKSEIGVEIDCNPAYTITQYQTEENLAAAVDALEEDGFYMNPENRIPADTLEEEWEREREWEAQQNP